MPMNTGETKTIRVPQGSILTLTPAASGTGTAVQIDGTGQATGVISVITGSATILGPFNADRIYRVSVTSTIGTLDPTITIPDPLLNAQINTDASLGNGAKLLTGAGVPVDGVSGTGANLAAKGSLYLDVTNGKAYVQGGTLASPLWKIITSA